MELYDDDILVLILIRLTDRNTLTYRR